MSIQACTKTIGGIEVDFPYPPYSSQICIIDRIVKAIEKKQNCLIESPTGSGKSLALLCSSLAWLKVEKKKQRANMSKCTELKCGIENASDNPNPHEALPNPPSRIYFGSRTHKQIAQLIRELRKTTYCDVKHTILSSREHACINPNVRSAPNKNEACKELIDPSVFNMSCGYYTKMKGTYSEPKMLRHDILLSQMESQKASWDIEELCDLGKKHRFCPYFATRKLKDDSEIVFCPYNYLIDPLIRQAMMINLSNDIVIFDEAHNIEDACREAASFELCIKDLTETIAEFERLLKFCPFYREALEAFRRVCSDISAWIHSAVSSENLPNFWDKKDHVNGVRSKVYTGAEAVAMLTSIDLVPEKLRELWQFFGDLEEREGPDQDEKQSSNVIKRPSNMALAVIEKILYIMAYIYRHDGAHVDDYKMALCCESSNRVGLSQSPQRNHGSGWLSKRRNHIDLDSFSMEEKLSLNFWCMSPVVAFTDLTESCRTIILASGTLSPFRTFESELGTQFPLRLEASHIIPTDQFWVGCIGKGPNNKSLRAVRDNVSSPSFQDEIGELILRVCKLCSGGVLCFFASYGVLNAMIRRWESTGLKSQISDVKVIYQEPQSGSSDLLSSMMKSYSEVIINFQSYGKACSGALFLGVCRGKLSEGMDFADNFARAVITVGIPYPNLGDTQVQLKRQYNDQRRKAHGGDVCISGDSWYETRAFRAINQGLGRSLRHKNDWGALILVDERFVISGTRDRYLKDLSKWIRANARAFESWERFEDSLEGFMEVTSENKALKPTQKIVDPCDLSGFAFKKSGISGQTEDLDDSRSGSPPMSYSFVSHSHSVDGDKEKKRILPDSFDGRKTTKRRRSERATRQKAKANNQSSNRVSPYFAPLDLLHSLSGQNGAACWSSPVPSSSATKDKDVSVVEPAVISLLDCESSESSSDLSCRECGSVFGSNQLVVPYYHRDLPSRITSVAKIDGSEVDMFMSLPHGIDTLDVSLVRAPDGLVILSADIDPESGCAIEYFSCKNCNLASSSILTLRLTSTSRTKPEYTDLDSKVLLGAYCIVKKKA